MDLNTAKIAIRKGYPVKGTDRFGHTVEGKISELYVIGLVAYQTMGRCPLSQAKEGDEIFASVEFQADFKGIPLWSALEGLKLEDIHLI